MPDSYRRITITTLLGKILEHLTLVPQKEILAKTQNPLQRGFSEQASSTNTAFFLTEAVAEARDQKTPLYLTLLDASKAFDIIWHASMLVALYWQGIRGDVWTMAASAYQNMSSKIRWNGSTSRTIIEGQGIRQGCLQSPEHFKARCNSLLNTLSASEHGFRIGSIPVGVPTCADDMALISSSLLGMQVMLDVAAQDASIEKYSFSEKKSKVLIVNSTTKVDTWNDLEPLSLAGNPLEVVEKQEHLGIERAILPSSHIAKGRISMARRALYAMMGAGMYGLNGISPVVSYKLWIVYILPRMIHSLEAIVVSKTDVRKLENYQVTVLKQIQILPEKAQNVAAYLLLGAVPVQAHLHRAMFTFYCNMLRNQGSLERELLRAVRDQVCIHQPCAVQDKLDQ